ncbi:MAG TPA: DUF5719 family protein [Microbacteriaceae bacterium]|nr:DUF5719 family protein [Microbacteriaceae bacterium]
MMKNKRLDMVLRIATGAVLSAAGAILLINLSVLNAGGAGIAPLTGAVPQTTVDTETTTSNSVVCPGSFAVLGLDPSSPDTVTPTGKPEIYTSEQLFADTTISSTPLAQPERIATEFEQPTVTLTTTGENQVAAAATQKIAIETVSGQTALSCSEAFNDQWIVAGSTTMGHTGMISLNNPGLVPATVNLTVHDETGKKDARASSGILIAPKSQRIVSLAGFGAGKESTVVRVESSGSPVVASMSLTEIRDLTPTGAEQINSQAEPTQTLVFAGIVNFAEHVHSAEDADQADEYPATLRLLATTESVSDDWDKDSIGTSATAVIVGLTTKGEEIELAAVNLTPGVVKDTQIKILPETVEAIVVRSQLPVVGGIKTATHSSSDHDFTWYAPSSIYGAGETMPVAAAAEAVPVIVNLSEEKATVTVTSGSAEKQKVQEVEVAPQATKKLAKGVTVSVVSEGEISAGMVIFNQKTLASYPVLKPRESLSQLTVFPR